MYSAAQECSEFTFTWLHSDDKLNIEQVTAACKQYGSILSSKYSEDGDPVIAFERSTVTDSLKPLNVILIEEDVVYMRWTSDCWTSRPVPPSSQKITALSDNCLRAVFLKLASIDLNALGPVASTCQRFRNSAKSMKLIELTAKNLDGWSLLELERFLRIWGASIRTANLNNCQLGDDLLVLLSDYCENLAELEGSIVYSSTIPRIFALFPRLQRLHLKDSRCIGLSLFDHLATMHLPNLRDLEVIMRRGTDKSSFIQFFTLNQQIERLFFHPSIGEHPISDELLGSLTFLKELHLIVSGVLANKIQPISQLKCLHTLRAHDIDGDTVSLFRALAENGVPSKCLVFQGNSYSETGIDEEIDCISRMTWLKCLDINGLCDDGLAKLIENCINLEEIRLSGSITSRGIRDAMKNAICLKKISFKIEFLSPYSLRQTLQGHLRHEIDIIHEIAKLRKDRSIFVEGIIRPSVGSELLSMGLNANFYEYRHWLEVAD